MKLSKDFEVFTGLTNGYNFFIAYSMYVTVETNT